MPDRFEAELSRLYREQFPRLQRYLDRTIGDPQQATDIAQEAFVRLFERGRMPDEVGAWLVTVANNLLRDNARRRGRRLRLLEAAGEPVATGAPSPGIEEQLEREERRGAVREALATLAARDRDALLLRHSGYSYREIGLTLGIAETSVGTILLRAGAAFRATWEGRHGQSD